jgi:mannose-6-phosphate isomerase-like protein (cupin superfamily)
MIKVISKSSSDQIYANTSYIFYRSAVENGSLIFGGNFDRLVYVVDGSFTVQGHPLEPGDTVQIKGRVTFVEGTGTLYVAQAAIPHEDTQQIVKITRAGAHYKVVKPWGHELWLNGEGAPFCAKRIFIKAGTQTSLQYHNFKEETNLVEDGQVVLVKQRDMSIAIDDVQSQHLEEVSYTGPVCFHVVPRTIHRLRAITDLNLFEVSTPHLDDVIRLQDDANRSHGRIDSEHQ